MLRWRIPVNARTFARLLSVLLVSASACAHVPEPNVSPGGRIEVSNQTGEPVELFVNGSRLASIDRNRSRFIDRLPLGSVTFEAVGSVSGHRFSRDISLERDRATGWRIDPHPEQARMLDAIPKGRLTVVNRTSEPIRPFIDGIALEMVYPGAQVVVADLDQGSRVVRAVGVRTAFEQTSEVAINADSSVSFLVEEPRPAIRLVNTTFFPILVSLEDLTERRLDPGMAAVLPMSASGPMAVYARDLQGREVWSGTAERVPGQVTDVRIEPPRSTIAVLSELDQSVSIVADGRLLGRCDAGGAAEFQGMPSGPVRLEAVAEGGRTIGRTRMNVIAGRKSLWVLKEGSSLASDENRGSILVRNLTREDLRIEIDGADRGRVSAEGRREIPDLSVGLRSARAVGTRSGYKFQSDIEITGGGRTEWRVAPWSATLSLRNERDEEVRVLAGRAQMAMIAPSETFDLVLPAGAHMIESVGVKTLSITTHRVELPASTVTRLALPRPFASIRVVGAGATHLEVLVDDRIVGVVPPGEPVVFDGIEPGIRRITARSLTSPVSWTSRIHLFAGETWDWEPMQ
jgi:hypothetical protein